MRPTAVAGTWYPSSPDALARDVNRYLADADESPEPTAPIAIVVPHAGLMYSGHVAAHAFRAAMGASYAAAVIVGPSHYVDFEGVSVWPRGGWETPFGVIPVDETFADRLLALPPVIDLRSAHEREHSLELELPFISRALPGVPIVPLVMGRQTRRTIFGLAESLTMAAAGVAGRVLFVASSDLSHFHDAPTARAMDDVVLGHIERLEPEGLMRSLERQPHHACGGGPIVSVMAAAARLGSTQARVLKYADSGDVNGDKSSVVGYLAAALW